MNHSFNVEIAKKYGIEKAILIENFYFWVIKNKANKKNIHEGRAYTYNTAEALSELFPYIKTRKIASILREMEYEDNLILSGQFMKYDRTKSYTLSDIALPYFESSNIQKLNNETYQNDTMENQKKVSCLNTDINQNINTIINTDKEPQIATQLDDDCYTLSTLLYELHHKVDNKYHITFAQHKNWALDINKIHRLDGREYSEIEEIIRWVKTDGNFWFPNIMSGEKLRKQFSRLLIDMKKSRTFQKPKSRISADDNVGDW